MILKDFYNISSFFFHNLRPSCLDYKDYNMDFRLLKVIVKNSFITKPYTYYGFMFA